MKKRMKKLASLLLSVSMTFSMISFPVYATPADDTENETAVTTESPETEEPADAAGETTEPVAEEQETTQPEPTNPDTTEPEAQQEEEQPTVTPIEENFIGYTVHAEDIDVSGVTPHSVSVDEEDAVEVDENDPVMSTIEEELQGMTVLNEDGDSVALTPEQIQTILYLWSEYQKQWEDNADVLGVQMPFFLSYNDDNEDGLGVLGEMLVLAQVPVDDVRNGDYSYDDLLGMIQNFYYADQFGIQYYKDAIIEKRDEAIKKVKDSGAETMAQKMLVLNDWIAHNATFDMSYIMQDDDGNPIMVAKEKVKHERYDDIHEAMYNVYYDQIKQSFHDQIYDGIVADLRQQFYENAIWNIVYQRTLGKNEQEATEDEIDAAKNAADDFMNTNADKISKDPDAFVREAFGEQGDAIADELKSQADAFIKDAKKNGVALDQSKPDEKTSLEDITQDTMQNQEIVEMGTDENGDKIMMTPNKAIPIYADAAATGLTEGILGAWEGNHIGILAEGYGVCAGYAKAFAYLLQCMSPEQYGKDGAGTDMSVASNWKTAKELYYDEEGNLDISRNYVVDMVRITFSANTTMFGEESLFGEVHFWNAVKVDGTWYYVDPCYTDIYVECMSRDRVEIDGTMNHMYFMFSHDTAVDMYDGNMPKDGIASLYSGEEECAAHDKSYEDSWMARVSTNAFSDGTKFYYMYDSTDQLAMMREFKNMQDTQGSEGSEGTGDYNKSDFEALMEGSDPTYSIVYHSITGEDKSGGADSDFTPLVEFNYKVNEDDDTTVARVLNASGDMEENELLTELFAQYKEECDIYPSIKMTCALYNNKIYFNLSNCILSYDLSSCEIETVKVYDTVSGKRDNTIAFGGMAFSVCDESEADFTFENHPIAAMTIKDVKNESGQLVPEMYVSVATNLGFISGKSAVNDTEHFGYAFEESNYNPDYSTYTSNFDIEESKMEEMGYSKEINDNDEFMWSAVFVDKIDVTNPCTEEHTYASVTVEPTCGRDGYTENRCTKCGAVEAGTRVVNEGTACDHHYVHFYEQYYTYTGEGENKVWNTGDCYVCTICGFAIEEPTEPTKNDRETQDEFEERYAEYEEENKIYLHAVEIAGHTYEVADANWAADNMSATVTGSASCTVCQNKHLDALGANAYDPKTEDNAANGVIDTTLEKEVELIVGENGKTVSGTCNTGLTISYVATGTSEDGKKITAKKTEITKAGRHDYVATWHWSEVKESEGEETEDVETRSEESESPYTATVDIKCSVCEDSVEGLEASVALDKDNSQAATCDEPGWTVYKATAVYTKAEGEEPYIFETTDEDRKVDEIPATGHNYKGAITWVEKTDEAGNKTGEWDATAVFTCQNDNSHKLEGDDVEVTVTKENTSASCDQAGKVTYTATAKVKGEKGEGIDPVTETKEVETDATGHSYSDDAEHAVWTWSKDYKSATLELTCTSCGEKVKIENQENEEDVVKVTYQTNNATCTVAGTTIYTATAKYEGVTYKDEKTVTDKPLGHDYNTNWNWDQAEDMNAEVPYTATLDLTCKRCDFSDKGIPANVRLKEGSTISATCDKPGQKTYIAEVQYNETIRFETEQPFYTEAATGHEWSEWKTVKEPTETEKGLEQRTCSKCGKEETNEIAPLATPSVEYRTHVQDFGWQATKADGETAGTSGVSKRLEAIEIKLADNESYTGSIEYRTHVQDIGWQGYVKDGATAGTSKQSKRLEAIQIRLTGDIANYYHVYYRVHAQDYGWLDWACDDQVAGTYGLSKRLEAIEIMLVRDGDPAPGSTNKPYVFKNVSYSTHVQDIGWQAAQVNGDIAGTTGKSKRLEAIKINLENQQYKGDIIYTTHIQDIGWQDKTEADWKKNGALSGTSGQSKRLESIRIKLTGEMAEHYDVYYRVHAQEFGWMGWASNGQAAGTAGYSYRLEAIQIQLVPKGEAAPGSTNNAFRQK